LDAALQAGRWPINRHADGDACAASDASLGGGCDVFVEKPLSHTLEGVED